MKCPNCGEELGQGHLYCEKCGEEIRIVPDFEPEIENSIIETLSAVAEDVEPQKDETSEESEEDVFIVEPVKKVRKRIIYAFLLFAVFIFGVYRFALIRIADGQGTYLDEQIENARSEYNRKNYKEAAGFYEKALKREQNSELLISYADCLIEMGETDRAMSNYYAAIDLEPDNEMAYARIIAMYESEQAFEEINKLLVSCNNEKIQTAFQNYMALEPVFNYESGTYDKVVPLKITAPTSGDLYYTLNGSDPFKYGTLYTSPIFLRSGT
ncbi:MAG: tetratricopeptide repeat protein, partial [Lachnospiraceae bacterium]|nr:tetratricopeptide repeat protein [Lachnospiraceae bacterium]